MYKWDQDEDYLQTKREYEIDKRLDELEKKGELEEYISELANKFIKYV